MLFKNLFASGRAAKSALEQRIAAADAAGDLAETIAARRALLELAPRDAPTWVALAERLRRDGQLAPAAAAYEQALDCGAPPGPVLLQLGALRHELEDFPAAQQAFSRLVALEPANADAWCMLGVVGKDQGRYAEAMAHFDKALQLQPAFAEAFFNLGLTQFELGQLAEASRSFLRCVELRGGPFPAFDAQIPPIAMPPLFGAALADVPWSGPYI
ncbi:MAG: tetratricopeptide repeat protein, partial [Burkholderiales bacterium]